MVELATPEEMRAFRARIKEARKLEQERQRASQIQFTVLSEADVRTLQRSGASDSQGRMSYGSMHRPERVRHFRFDCL